MMPDASILRRIETAFGHDRGFPQPTFYAFANALRFDLGGDVEAVGTRFLQAIDRARAIARALFARSGMLTAVAPYYGDYQPKRRAERWQDTLKELGFTASFDGCERTWEDDDPERFCDWYMADFGNDPALIDAILSANIASELGVTPKARWLPRIFIADFERRLILFAYDDRGMDVVAMAREPLQPIYDQFSDWLLDSDRARMDTHFAARFG